MEALPKLNENKEKLPHDVGRRKESNKKTEKKIYESWKIREAINMKWSEKQIKQREEVNMKGHNKCNKQKRKEKKEYRKEKMK